MIEVIILNDLKLKNRLILLPLYEKNEHIWTFLANSYRRNKIFPDLQKNIFDWSYLMLFLITVLGSNKAYVT